MTNENFAYWLQGYAEICGDAPNAAQWQIIKDHLQTVFQKVTPVRGIPNWAAQPAMWPSMRDAPGAGSPLPNQTVSTC